MSFEKKNALAIKVRDDDKVCLCRINISCGHKTVLTHEFG